MMHCLAVRFKETPNARHQPPRLQHSEEGVSRMKAPLVAVGCMALLDAAFAFNCAAD
jgi:hypothetical protein